MSEILLRPVTAYFAGDVELWDVRRIAAEYGVSKGKVREWEKSYPSFPEPFAVSESGKKFYELKKIRAWAEDECDAVVKTLEKKARGVGRPSQNYDLVKANRA